MAFCLRANGGLILDVCLEGTSNKSDWLWNICQAEHAPFLASDMPKRKRYGHGLITLILI